jgi:hypothetical protein
MVAPRSRDRQEDCLAGFALGPRDGLLASFSASAASAKAGSWSHFLGGAIGGPGQHPASVQKNTFSHDRQQIIDTETIVALI